jgi:hypothetical protein
MYKKIHAALYGLRVAAIAGEKLVVKKIMRKPTKKDKNNDRFLLGGNPAGRTVLAQAIQYVYEMGNWMGVGMLPIGCSICKRKVK